MIVTESNEGTKLYLLVGGKGERLSSVTKGKPKPLVEVNHRPFINYVLDSLKGFDITLVCSKDTYWDFKGYENIGLEVINEGYRAGTGGFLIKIAEDAPDSFYVQSGEILLRYGKTDDYEKSETIVLKPGDKFYVPPGLRHQMTGIKNTELFEFSTQHFEDDSYRIIRGD